MRVEFEKAVGHRFSNPSLLETALVHASATNEPHGRGKEANDVLALFGDAVLRLGVVEILLSRNPRASVGDLSIERDSWVDHETQCRVAGDIGVTQQVLLGRGEEARRNELPPLILERSLEAIVGAIYRDAGFAAARDAIEHMFAKELARRSPE